MAVKQDMQVSSSAETEGTLGAALRAASEKRRRTESTGDSTPRKPLTNGSAGSHTTVEAKPETTPSDERAALAATLLGRFDRGEISKAEYLDAQFMGGLISYEEHVAAGGYVLPPEEKAEVRQATKLPIEPPLSETLPPAVAYALMDAVDPKGEGLNLSDPRQARNLSHAIADEMASRLASLGIVEATNRLRYYSEIERLALDNVTVLTAILEIAKLCGAQVHLTGFRQYDPNSVGTYVLQLVDEKNQVQPTRIHPKYIPHILAAITSEITALLAAQRNLTSKCEQLELSLASTTSKYEDAVASGRSNTELLAEVTALLGSIRIDKIEPAPVIGNRYVLLCSTKKKMGVVGWVSSPEAKSPQEFDVEQGDTKLLQLSLDMTTAATFTDPLVALRLSQRLQKAWRNKQVTWQVAKVWVQDFTHTAELGLAESRRLKGLETNPVQEVFLNKLARLKAKYGLSMLQRPDLPVEEPTNQTVLAKQLGFE